VFEGTWYELFLKRNSTEQSLGHIKVVITGHRRYGIPHFLLFGYFSDSLNRSVCASEPKGLSAPVIARSFRYVSFPRHCSGTGCRP
jgi:sugar phosphate permease